MKKFLLLLFLILGCPILLLLGVFLYTDPYRTLHPFNPNNIDITNREYLSTELFLQNKNIYPYNSFVFSSSRGCGINTYTWKMFLGNTKNQPFLFQAWAETITGVELKIQYLFENNIPIDNALILLDIPSSFAKEQLPTNAMSIKHPMISRQPKWIYNTILFYNYCQKPSQWINSIKSIGNRCPLPSDSVTNDWYNDNAVTYATLLPMDSLKGCSQMTRRTFFQDIKNKNVDDIIMSSVLIDDSFKSRLCHIKQMFDEIGTDYHVIITPAYCYTSTYINDEDLLKLERIFGQDRVHDFTRHYITLDYNYFSDPNHFGLRAGYIMLEEIYGARTIEE